jgi:hypothetical protein
MVRDYAGQMLPRKLTFRGNFALWGNLYFFFTKYLEKLYLRKLAFAYATARPESGHFEPATPVPRRTDWSCSD